MHGCDPYQMGQLTDFYETEGHALPQTLQARETLIRYVNLPSTFVVVAPFSLFPWHVALAAWMGLILICVFTASVLITRIAVQSAPRTSMLLSCLLLVNCEVVLATGNTAGLTIGLCVIAVVCFTQNRHIWAGIVCLAISLAVKPHDVGFIWLYFILAGGATRKHALKAMALTALIAVAAVTWVSIAAPHWVPEMKANLAQISGPGGLNDPGPHSLTGNTAAMVINLQALLSVFRDEPSFYTLTTYAVCGVLLLLWAIRTTRRANSGNASWFALSSVAAITMLVTYHRPYDAKLLLVTIPACAILWSRGGWIGRVALAVTTFGILMTSDIPLAISIEIARHFNVAPVGFGGKVLAAVLTRPASLALLIDSIFYLWVYLRETKDTRPTGDADSRPLDAAVQPC